MSWTYLINNASSQFSSFGIQDSLVHPTTRKILGFKRLKAGWHYGEGIPFEEKYLQMAIDLNQVAVDNGFLETDTFPSLDGGVMIVIYYEQHDLEFTVEIDNTVTFAHDLNGEELSYQEGLSYDEVKQRIKTFRKEAWSLSESSKRATTLTGKGNDSKAQPLAVQVGTGPFQPSINLVLFRLVTQSVVTFDDIMDALPTNPQFFSSTSTTYYPMDVQ